MANPNAMHEDNVQILPPDYSLKKIIGENVDINAVFDEDTILKAQAVIHSHKKNFLEWVKHDLAEMEAHYKEAIKNVDNSKSAIEKLTHLAFVLKSQAGIFGYQLATLVAKSLDDFCTSCFQQKNDHLVVIRKHLDTLNAIFEKNITGDGAEIGNSLFSSLQALIKKYTPK